MKKSFTFWGGLQFDRDVRRVSAFFTNLNTASSAAAAAAGGGSAGAGGAGAGGGSGGRAQASGSSAGLQSVRDKFAKLVQIASILQVLQPSGALCCVCKALTNVTLVAVLQLDKAAEILDYWGDNASEVWRLYDNEVRKVLLLRTDFSQKEIAQLKL